jgi:hypothetical protein
MMTFDENHHVEIVVYLCEGPQTLARPEDPQGKHAIVGLSVPAETFPYREIAEAHMEIISKRMIRAMEESGILK